MINNKIKLIFSNTKLYIPKVGCFSVFEDVFSIQIDLSLKEDKAKFSKLLFNDLTNQVVVSYFDLELREFKREKFWIQKNIIYTKDSYTYYDLVLFN